VVWCFFGKEYVVLTAREKFAEKIEREGHSVLDDHKQRMKRALARGPLKFLLAGPNNEK
jgi:hypothetical protein